VADRAASPARVVAADGVWRSTVERMSAPARELARRLSGTDEVLLLWHPDSKHVELSVRDLATGASLDLEVPPGSAIDAFHHPYAYVAWPANFDHVVRDEAATDDG
jgi:hypothetical protein